MSFSSVLVCLVAVTVPAVGQVVRSNRVGSGAWSQAAVQSSSHLGLPFWRRLRQELEAKKKELALNEAREALQLSAAARRDLLWHAVREIDDRFRQRYACEIEEGTTFNKQARFLHGQTTYSKKDIESARECALMCAADTLGSGDDLSCKSFVYNKTARECKFFNFAQQAQGALVKDDCCTSGPPCNLASMRQEIQKAFEVELKRVTSKVEHKAVEHKAVEQVKHVAPKVEHKAVEQIKHVAPKVDRKVAEHILNVAPKVEHKVVEQIKHVVPEVEHKAAAQTKHVMPKVEEKVAVHVAPRVEKKVAVPVAAKVDKSTAVQPKHSAPMVDLKVATEKKQVAPQEEPVAVQPTPVKPLADKLPLNSGAAKHGHGHHNHRNTKLALYALAGTLAAGTSAVLAWRCRSLFSIGGGGSLKQLNA